LLQARETTARKQKSRMFLSKEIELVLGEKLGC
jgi:hypothetical protein